MPAMSPAFPRGSATNVSPPHIILVGISGAGKSTVGQAVAARLNREFMDLDQEIEKRE